MMTHDERARPYGNRRASSSPCRALHRGGRSLALALLAIILAGFDDPSPRKALIEFGWDEPDTRFLQTHLAELERTPFDGCVFHVDAGVRAGKPASLTWEGWGKRTFVENDVRAAREDLRAVRPTRFTRNFLRFNCAPANLDWFDDFTPVLANARLAASLAHDGHAAGILLDTEQYQGRLFEYRAQRDAKSKPWTVYASQARARGMDVMTSIQEAFPDVVVFLTFGTSLPARDQIRSGKPLEAGEYGLLAPFVDGLVAAARGKSRIVDGFELSYGFKTREQFDAGRRLMTEGIAPIVTDAASYRRVVTRGFGLWLDYEWQTRGWNERDLSRNYFSPEAFETSVRLALDRSDEYVWIYSETPRWWSPGGKPVKLPKPYEDALRRARLGPLDRQ